MLTLLTVIHVIVCLFLIIVVLLQHGKGADIGATFGGSSQTLFGSEGPLPLLNKITTAAAIIFMCTSVGLAYYATHAGTDSIMRGLGQPAPAARTEAAPPATQTETAQPAAPTETVKPTEQKPQPPEAAAPEAPAPVAAPVEEKTKVQEAVPDAAPAKAKTQRHGHSRAASEKKK